MDRRRFNVLLLKATPAAILGRRTIPHRSAAESQWDHERYADAIVIDSLCAPVVDLEAGPSADTLSAVRQSGITAVNFSISVPDGEETLYNLANVQSMVDDYPEAFQIVRRHSDIARCKQERKLGIMLGFQYPTALEEDLARIETYRKLGVRIMQLTYNSRGKFGGGCLDRLDAGITTDGRLAITTMNKVGVAVDLSHAGYRTTSEGIAESSKPVLISHAGCAAVHAHPRNQPDDNLKALADRGGYFGVYLMPYLVGSPTVPTRQHVLDHLVHAINACGSDHVGIGSDGVIEKMVFGPEQKAAFDENVVRRRQGGMSAPGEDRYPYVPDLSGADRLEAIAGELARRGQTASVIEKVLGANFQRVIGDVWGTH